ncbi:MAG: OmpA family protein [Nitrococcus sp.]|nr:OmpA family protein [Nitrococcus sp.]
MNARILVGLLVAVMLTACVGIPTQQSLPAIERAEQAVSAAAADAQVQRYTAATLQQAQDTLQAAQSAWTKGQDQARAEHLAYMALGRAQIAAAMAAEQAAAAQAKLIMEQRDTLRLRSRGRQIEELKEQLSELKPKQTAEGIVLTIGDVLFAFDSAELSAAADAPLDKLASFLRAHPSYRVRVEGYTDSVGSMAYNQRLSERRAQSVADAMMARGIASGRMTVVGYGEANPVAPNSTEAGRARNRRVELVILGVGTSPGTPEASTEPQRGIR